MRTVYPACPDPHCDYIHHGRPIRIHRGTVEILLSHTVERAHKHRARVTIYADGTQEGEMLARDEKFEDVEAA